MKNLNKKIKLLDLNFKKNLGNDFFGLYKSKFHGVGMEFAELKEYNFGDSIKNIDWKSSARKGKIFSKKMEEERDLKILFVLDNFETMNFGSKKFTKKEVLEQIFYAISFAANSSGDSVGGFIFSENGEKFFPEKKGNENIVRIISDLNSCHCEEGNDVAIQSNDVKKEKNNNLGKNNLNLNKNGNSALDCVEFMPGTGTTLAMTEKNNLQNIFQKIHKMNLKNNLIFVLTDKINFSDEKILRVIGKENEIIFINIFDDFELNLTGDFGENIFENFSGIFSDGKNFSQENFFKKIFFHIEKFFGIGEKNFSEEEKFQKKISEKLNFLENFYKKNSCKYLFLNTGRGYFRDLVRFFKK